MTGFLQEGRTFYNQSHFHSLPRRNSPPRGISDVRHADKEAPKVAYAPPPRPPLSPPTMRTEPRRRARRDLPRSALCPLSSGRNLLSTAHTRRWSGRLGDLAPTRRKPAGTSMGSLEMETRRRSFPAWQNPRRNGRAHHAARGCPEQEPHDRRMRASWAWQGPTPSSGCS